MPPIDLFTNSAINAAKASAVTPQTTDSQHASSTNQNAPPATTTSHEPPYPQARPGAAAVPTPTGVPQRYAPATVQPTPTTTFIPNPPAPQPGSFPSLNQDSIPPPPRAGEAPVPYPPQMYMPPPATAYAAQPPASTTSTTNLPASAYPVPLPTSQYENPPGYRQNPYASDLTPDQRRAQDASMSSSDLGGSYGHNESAGETSSLAMDAQNMWDTAKQWASKAGEKLSDAESEVWKRVNK